MVSIFSVVESKTQALLELLVVVILAGIIQAGVPGITSFLQSIVPSDSALVPFIPFLAFAVITIVAYIPYEYLSKEGVALFEKLRNSEPAKAVNDKGELGVLGYIVIAVLFAVIAVVAYAVFILHVDLAAVVACAVVIIMAWIASLKLRTEPKPTVTLPDWLTFADYNGYTTAFVDVERWRKSTAYPAETGYQRPGDYYDIMSNVDGVQQIEPDAWLVIVNGSPVVFSVKNPDPFAGAFSSTSATDVMNGMNSIASGAGKLDYLMAQLAARGYPMSDIKASLCLAPKVLSDMKASDFDHDGIYDYQLFLQDKLPIAGGELWGITKAWAGYLTDPDAVLVKTADQVFNTYWQ